MGLAESESVFRFMIRVLVLAVKPFSSQKKHPERGYLIYCFLYRPKISNQYLTYFKLLLRTGYGHSESKSKDRLRIRVLVRPVEPFISPIPAKLGILIQSQFFLLYPKPMVLFLYVTGHNSSCLY